MDFLGPSFSFDRSHQSCAGPGGALWGLHPGSEGRWHADHSPAPRQAGVSVGLGCSPGHQPPSLGEAMGSSRSLAVREERVRLTFPGRREGVEQFGETSVVFAAQVSSFTEVVCRPLWCWGPFRRTGSRCLLCRSAVGWGMQTGESLVENDALTLGQSLSFLTWCCSVILLYFVLFC